MHVRSRFCIRVGLIILGWACTSSSARADMITTSASFTVPATLPPVFAIVSLDRFDTEGGTRVLTGVDIEYTIDPLTIFLKGENFRATPVSVSAAISGSVSFTPLPGGPPSATFSFPVNRSKTYSLGPSDGVAGSGSDYFEDAVGFSFFGTRSGVPAEFIGTGTFDLRIPASGNVVFTPAVTIPPGFPAELGGTVMVRYTFDSSSAIPEPSSITLCALATLATCGYAWRRGRRTVLRAGSVSDGRV